MRPLRPLAAVLLAAAAGCGAPRTPPPPATVAASEPYSPAQCPSCAEWNAATPPRTIHGNVHWVGTRGLGALLLTSTEGHVLVDAGLPESAAPIAASIATLGFRLEDIRLIVNSHAHYDHAGGIAALQRASDATIAAHPWSAAVLRTGETRAGDPQRSIALRFPAAPGRVREIADGDTLRVGPIVLTAHFTGGHTPGGTTWSWRSCDGADCRDFVYADSQTPVSADDFLYTRSAEYPQAIADFERGFAVLERLSCDVLLTPHPAASRMWERLAAADSGTALRDPEGCRRLAAGARAALARRVERENAGR